MPDIVEIKQAVLMHDAVLDADGEGGIAEPNREPPLPLRLSSKWGEGKRPKVSLHRLPRDQLSLLSPDPLVEGVLVNVRGYGQGGNGAMEGG